MTGRPHVASFRDPSGFVFEREGTLYRQVNASFREHWGRFQSSGLAARWVDAGDLVRWDEVGRDLALTEEAIAVLRPERLPVLGYPYEWSFGQLKDAALLTLRLAREALDAGMVLKDASAYNIQFVRGRPVFLDTLSFEIHHPGAPWVAYRQFCRHFLAPLALMAHVDVRLIDLLRVHLDGIPLDLAARLLPGKTRVSPGLLAHIHLHARAETAPARERAAGRPSQMSDTALRALFDNLQSTVEQLNWEPGGTPWGDYYADTNYTSAAAQDKAATVRRFLERAKPAESCWDLGANDGTYSRLAVEAGLRTVAWDVDSAAVEQAYRWVRSRGEDRLLPLRMDLANPSPGIGWGGVERESFFARGPVDVVMALALVHHLAFTHHVPLGHLFETLARIGRWAIVEFVPREDSQARRLLATHTRAFEEYDEAAFGAALAARFEVVESCPITESARTLYLLRKRDG